MSADLSKFIQWPFLIFQFLVSKLNIFGESSNLWFSTTERFLSLSLAQVSYSIGFEPSFQSLTNSLWETAEILNKTIQNKTKTLASPIQQTPSPSHIQDAKGSRLGERWTSGGDKSGLGRPWESTSWVWGVGVPGGEQRWKFKSRRANGLQSPPLPLSPLPRTAVTVPQASSPACPGFCELPQYPGAQAPALHMMARPCVRDHGWWGSGRPEENAWMRNSGDQDSGSERPWQSLLGLWFPSW